MLRGAAGIAAIGNRLMASVRMKRGLLIQASLYR